MSTFLDFIKNKKNIYEAYNEGNIKKLSDKLHKLYLILSKKTKNLVELPGNNYTSIDSNILFCKFYISYTSPKNIILVKLNWKDSQLYSIDFFDNLNILYDNKTKAKLSIYTEKSSIVYFIPIIVNILNTRNLDISDIEAIKIGRSVYNSKDIKEDMQLDRYLSKKKSEMKAAYWTKDKSKEDQDRYNSLYSEYQEIKQAIENGAETLSDLKLSIKHNEEVTIEIDSELQRCEDQFKKLSKMDPQQVFKMMDSYVKMVIKGINPSVILCGAPGTGKTYRVTKLLKENGYNESNLAVIKGKCSTRILYTTLYNFKDKGDIILIDDADGLVGPKAPEESINILKAALDSTSSAEGRQISYSVAGKLVDIDDNEIPKRFYFNGGVIIITNYNAGSLDTALRGRSYIQDICFTQEQLLKLVKDIMPSIDPENLSMKTKNKAYNYMLDLISETDEIEISIRTFKICAQIFESLGEGDEDIAKLMIKEQLRLQSLRYKNKKY